MFLKGRNTDRGRDMVDASGMNQELFDKVHSVLQGTPNRRGFYNANCIWCGKEAKPGQNHFGYRFDPQTGMGFGLCFVCGNRGSLAEIAKQLNLDTHGHTPIVRVPEPAPKLVARWREHPDKLLEGYRSHPRRFDAWRRYKALTSQTVSRFDFGVGRLAFQRENGTWSISRQGWGYVPIYERGALVCLRGRNRTQRGPKWISGTGSTYTLWGVDHVRPGAVTWLCENYVDAAWLMQEHPDWCAVAIGGATTWKAEWAEMLAMRKPELVIVALDRDLPGQATGAFRAKLEKEWIQQRGIQPPPANGPKIANSLLRLGVEAVLFEWPDSAPEKADIGWALAQMKVAA